MDGIYQEPRAAESGRQLHGRVATAVGRMAERSGFSRNTKPPPLGDGRSQISAAIISGVFGRQKSVQCVERIDMKVIVSVKRVIDYNVKVRVKSDNSGVDLDNVKMSMNPFCEIAVEEAVRLKESGVASEVIVVSVGPKACQEQIRTALALGADRGIQIDTQEMPESLVVAKLLAKVIDEEKPELVILGKQSIDSDNNQTGQMLGALLGMPQGTFASEIKLDDGTVYVTREVDGGLQTLALNLPAVVTTDLRLNEPRYAALPNIMKAKRKPLSIRTPEELGVEIKIHTRLLKVSTPCERQAGVIVGSVDELINKLRNEVKVI